MQEYTRTFGQFLIYLFVMAGVTYLLRLLPMLFIRKPIKSVFIRSFLHYMPYSVLTVMSFPAILYISPNIITGVIATLVAVILSYIGKSLITVAAGSALSVLICELIITLITK